VLSVIGRNKTAALGQNRGRGGAILTPSELVFPSGVLTSVPVLVKIDQEMRP